MTEFSCIACLAQLCARVPCRPGNTAVDTSLPINGCEFGRKGQELSMERCVEKVDAYMNDGVAFETGVAVGARTRPKRAAVRALSPVARRRGRGGASSCCVSGCPVPVGRFRPAKVWERSQQRRTPRPGAVRGTLLGPRIPSGAPRGELPRVGRDGRAERPLAIPRSIEAIGSARLGRRRCGTVRWVWR